MSDSIKIGSSFFAGSTRWMAPELILALVEDDGGVPPITTYSDVYAFGSVCLEVWGFISLFCRPRDQRFSLSLYQDRNGSNSLPSSVKRPRGDCGHHEGYQTFERCYLLYPPQGRRSILEYVGPVLGPSIPPPPAYVRDTSTLGRYEVPVLVFSCREAPAKLYISDCLFYV